MKRHDLSTIMRRAWAIARATGKAFAVCLSKAWQLYRLTKRMRAAYMPKGRYTVREWGTDGDYLIFDPSTNTVNDFNNQ